MQKQRLSAQCRSEVSVREKVKYSYSGQIWTFFISSTWCSWANLYHNVSWLPVWIRSAAMFNMSTLGWCELVKMEVWCHGKQSKALLKVSDKENTMAMFLIISKVNKFSFTKVLVNRLFLLWSVYAAMYKVYKIFCKQIRHRGSLMFNQTELFMTKKKRYYQIFRIV